MGNSIIVEVILPYVTTFAHVRVLACTCKLIRDNIDRAAIITDKLNNINLWMERLSHMRFKLLITGSLDIVSKLVTVEHLFIDDSDDIQNISHLTLDSLTLSYTNVDLSMIPQIKRLNIGCHLNDDINISHLTRIETLYLYFCDLPDLTMLSSLTSLTIGDPADDDFDEGIHCPLSLRILDTPRYKVNDLMLMTNLTQLDARVSDAELVKLTSLTSLTIREPDRIHMSTLLKLPLLEKRIRQETWLLDYAHPLPIKFEK